MQSIMIPERHTSIKHGAVSSIARKRRLEFASDVLNLQRKGYIASTITSMQRDRAGIKHKKKKTNDGIEVWFRQSGRRPGCAFGAVHRRQEALWPAHITGKYFLRLERKEALCIGKI